MMDLFHITGIGNFKSIIDQIIFLMLKLGLGGWGQKKWQFLLTFIADVGWVGQKSAKMG